MSDRGNPVISAHPTSSHLKSQALKPSDFSRFDDRFNPASGHTPNYAIANQLKARGLNLLCRFFMRRSSGFTALELICVVSILMILFIVLVVPTMLPRCVYASVEPEYESKTRWPLNAQLFHKRELGEFATSIQELQEYLGFSGTVQDSQEYGIYQLSMEVKDDLVIAYATPRSTTKAQDKMHSYAKAGIWDESKNVWGQYVACKTQRPTRIRIETPVVKNGVLTCGDNSLEKLCDKGKYSQWLKSRLRLIFSKR